jgi:serine-type D-Ala-D-Ala carboxypeptidase (penicillin-binding protein 5/6)
MKKIIFFVIIVMILGLGSAPALADTSLTLNCKGALLMDGVSGEILFEQNSHEKCYPASVTKIMTMVLILEAVENGTVSLDDTVTVSAAAASMGGSQVYLYEGEQRTVHEMLLAIAVGSGNDASYAMAEYVGGTMEDFLVMMNSRAQELGMNDTHFTNVHGLHSENHYTSAYDMGLLAYYALQVPLFLDYTSVYEYEFRPEPKLLILWNTNRLLKWYEGTDGIKTGYTEEAGRNLVATVLRNNMRLISVVMGAEERQGHFNESMKLLNYGFNKYRYVPLYSVGDIVCEAPVSRGKADTVSVTVGNNVGYSCEKNQEHEINETIALTPGLRAPLKAGDIVGTLTVYKDGAKFLTADLLAAENLAKGGFFRTWGKLQRTMW